MPRTPESGKTGNKSTRTTTHIRRFPAFIRDMRNLPLSEEESLYQVSFSANVRKVYGAAISGLDYSRPYRTVHPLLALGLAMADIDNTYYSASVNITSVRIEKI